MKNNLKAIRLAKGMTQKQVAELLAMQCEDRLSHWERGSAIPTLANIFKLCKVYKVTQNELFPLETS